MLPTHPRTLSSRPTLAARIGASHMSYATAAVAAMITSSAPIDARAQSLERVEVTRTGIEPKTETKEIKKLEQDPTLGDPTGVAGLEPVAGAYDPVAQGRTFKGARKLILEFDIADLRAHADAERKKRGLVEDDEAIRSHLRCAGGLAWFGPSPCAA